MVREDNLPSGDALVCAEDMKFLVVVALVERVCVLERAGCPAGETAGFAAKPVGRGGGR